MPWACRDLRLKAWAAKSIDPIRLFLSLNLWALFFLIPIKLWWGVKILFSLNFAHSQYLERFFEVYMRVILWVWGISVCQFFDPSFALSQCTYQRYKLLVIEFVKNLNPKMKFLIFTRTGPVLDLNICTKRVYMFFIRELLKTEFFVKYVISMLSETFSQFFPIDSIF